MVGTKLNCGAEFQVLTKIKGRKNGGLGNKIILA
jgi:hypothetical protein